MVGCVQAMAGNRSFLVQFEGGQKKEMSCGSISYVYLKEGVCLDMDKPISDLPQKEQGDFLTIDGDPDFKEASMFGRGMYLSVF